MYELIFCNRLIEEVAIFPDFSVSFSASYRQNAFIKGKSLKFVRKIIKCHLTRYKNISKYYIIKIKYE
jgi:hypothetical protein